MGLRLLWSDVLGLEPRKRDRRPSTVSIVSHLSEDRLHQLQGLCVALAPDVSGPRGAEGTGVISICVAVLVQDRRGSARVRRAVRALHGIGQLVIRVNCFARAFRLPTRGPPKPCWYPINQLRNRAMALAQTDLVLICDIDFRPCQKLAWSVRATEAAALLKRASCRLNCIVLPAFEVLLPNGEEEDGDEDITTGESDGCCHTSLNTRTIAMPDKSFWSKLLRSKQGLLQMWTRDSRAIGSKPAVVPFASEVWAQGHRATNFEKWKRADAPYEVAYEEGFEPFVIMNRLLVPEFDERFEGYGRNKVIFFYRLHSLGFSFTVDPDLFLVHAPHERSDSWRKTFGRQAATGLPSKRFTAILEQYEIAKAEIEADAVERRDPRRDGHREATARRLLLGSSHKTRLGSWNVEGAAKLGELGGALRAATCSDVMKDVMRHALLSSMHALWYEYHPKGVVVIARLESRLGRGNSEITIFTQCSLSRLSRLERMSNRWAGVISAAIIAEGGGPFDRQTREEVSALHARIESGGKCRLDISLCQDAPGIAAGDGLYPVNSLRNVALKATKTDLVLSLDVDSMPMRGLHEVLSSPPTYNGLRQLCQGGTLPAESDTAFAGREEQTAQVDTPPTFVVIPALEFVGASSPDDPRIQALLEERNDSKRKAADRLVNGELQAFHAGCFPEGHRQTNLELWAALPADAAPYQIEYAEGYEPYGLFSRQLVPPFDERFRGFGLDKVSHCWHLHRLGWSFRGLPAAFLVDLPHPPTKHRNVHRVNPNFRASVDGLFQRFTTEVDRSIAATNSSLSSSFPKTPGKNSLGVKTNDGRPRDYEVLAELSLLAWGDAWMAAGACRHHPFPKLCGGGWSLKGSHSAWAGLRVPWADDNDLLGVCRSGTELDSEIAHKSATSERDTVALPPRMVGGWARVCLGGGGDGGSRDTSSGVNLHGRSAVRPKTLHGVMRYWVHPKWEPKQLLRGKLPGLGMSGDVRLFVRWRSGSVGFCSLMMLGRPLTDICEVHVIRQVPFSLNRNKTTAVQLEADMRRNPANGGSLSFRAWIDGSVVYEARVYASDAVVSGGQSKGMWVEDVFLHVLARASSDDKREEKSCPIADGASEQHVLIGGVEVWGRCPVENKLVKDVEEQEVLDADGGDEAQDKTNVADDVAPISSMMENLRFVFVASTGRCGTHFLSRLLATAPGVLAFHEAEPKLSGYDTLLSAATAPETSYPERRRKSTEILRSARQWLLQKHGWRGQAQQEGRSKPLIYVDTSHLFLKSFSDVVMRELAPHFAVDVVVLRRDPAASLKSRIDLGHFCGRNKQSDWLVLPLHQKSKYGGNDDGNRPATQGADIDGFEALIEYANVTEASIRKFKSVYGKKKGRGTLSSNEDDDDDDDDNNNDNHDEEARQERASLPHPPLAAESPSSSALPPSPGLSVPTVSCNIVETSLESLQTEQGVRKLFADLDLVVSEQRTWRVVEAGPTNTRNGEKRRTVPLEYCRHRIINTAGWERAQLAPETHSKRQK